MQRTYKVRDRQITLEVDETVVAVRFREPAPYSSRSATVEKSQAGAFRDRFEVPREKFTIIPVTGRTRASSLYKSASNRLGRSGDVDRVAQVFRVGDRRMLATDRISVKLNKGVKSVDAWVAKHELEIEFKVIEEFGENELLLELAPQNDPIDVVEALDADPEVEYAEPDFVLIGSHIARDADSRRHLPARGRGAGDCISKGDPLQSQQYALSITQANKAWDICSIDQDVVIAILDEGVETDHPDLLDAIVGAYDATDDDPWQEPNSWDAHGTACAGLAAAIHDNQEGIKGIAGGCAVLAVRIAYSEYKGGSWVTRNSWIRRAIDWSWQSGAAVLSNSWGGGGWSAAIVDAFDRARINGRNGLGSVVVVAAGNASSPVDFPGSEPEIFTVSASNEYDEFKTKTSRDGENWWGSSFGPEVDVAAPGVHNLTTDNMASDGYAAGNYTDFNGTSSATPIVAGVCALVLSANGDLMEAEVRQIIRETADKVGHDPYQNGRNDQMGFGRVNAFRAVERASTLIKQSADRVA